MHFPYGQSKYNNNQMKSCKLKKTKNILLAQNIIIFEVDGITQHQIGKTIIFLSVIFPKLTLPSVYLFPKVLFVKAFFEKEFVCF